MTKIKLTIKTGDVKESQQFEIDRVTVGQMLKLKTEIGGIMKELKGNGELGSFVTELFGGELDVTALNTDDEKAQALEQMKDERFITNLATVFDKLLETVPDRVINILSILSDIDKDIIKKLDFLELMDVYDAVMEVNDIEKIVNRVKQSFFGTKGTWSNMIQKMFKGNQTSAVAPMTQTFSK